MESTADRLAIAVPSTQIPLGTDLIPDVRQLFDSSVPVRDLGNLTVKSLPCRILIWSGW